MKVTKHIAVLLFTFYLLFGSFTKVFSADYKPTEGIDNQWLKVVLSIEQGKDLEKTKSIGTAFLVASPKNHILLVTAKHVVTKDGALLPYLSYRFNKSSGDSILIPNSLMEKHAGGWIVSKTSDIACRFIAIDNDSDIMQLPFDSFLSHDLVRPGARVLIPGFPLGLRSKEYAHPIVREGIVARSDSNNIVIDGFVFPGNSGGIALYVPTLKIGGQKGVSINSECLMEEKVIGLVLSNISYVERAISEQTKRPRVTFEDNAGLFNILPSNKILEFLNSEEVKKLDHFLEEKQTEN